MDRQSGTDALEALARAQAEGLGFGAWIGSAMMDHMVRTGAELAGFARDRIAQDWAALGRMAQCRDAGRLAELQQAHLGETLAACSAEAERLAERQREVCAVTLARMARG